METLLIKKGTQVAYDNLKAQGKTNDNTIYFTTDTHRIYIGNIEFSRPTECVNDLSFITGSGTIAAIDKQ